MAKRIGILTAGSDSPGLNAAIRAIGKTAISAYGMQVVGFLDGFEGLVNDQFIEVENNALSGTLTAGGTTLGTSRMKPHEFKVGNTVIDLTDQAIENYHKHHLDALVCLGGNETQESAARLSKAGLNILTLPHSIENNIPETDVSVGFDTALGVASEAIDRLHSTAHSHHRIMIVEITGMHAGWLTLAAGLSGGADVILIPEIPYTVEKVVEAILNRNKAGKRFSIVAIAEGAVLSENIAFFERSREMNDRMHTGEDREKVARQLEHIQKEYPGTTLFLADRLSTLMNLETRTTLLGYLLRGGAPSARDRILATQLGSACLENIQSGQFGNMLALQAGKVVPIPLESIRSRGNPVLAGHSWLISAKQVGTSLGD